ncbi:MAG: porin family protein [Bacteroidales bacterium]
MRIKQLVALILVLLFMPALSKAQYKAFALGFKTAPALGWLKTDTKDYDGGSSIGFSWGIVSEFNFSESYCVATGINFVYNNSNISYPDLRPVGGADAKEVRVERKLHIKYLQIPFTLKMRTGEIGKTRFFGQFGLATGFRLNAKGKDEYNNGTIIETQNNIGDQVAFIRESLLVGIGIEYNISSGNLVSAGISFDNGFTDVLASKNSVDPNLKPKATTSFIELSLGILF